MQALEPTWVVYVVPPETPQIPHGRSATAPSAPNVTMPRSPNRNSVGGVKRRSESAGLAVLSVLDEPESSLRKDANDGTRTTAPTGRPTVEGRRPATRQLVARCFAVFGTGAWADLPSVCRRADFTQVEQELEGKGSGRRQIGKADYQARGVMYVPETARFGYLRTLPEGADIGQALNRAMEAIEVENTDLKGVLPRDYARFDNSVLAELLRLIGSIPDDIEGDAFGKIYEYFLGNFAMTEGQRGGEFFTPTSIVKLIVDIIEPFQGRILDPACGSGGMFVQSARFVEQHQKNPANQISIFGQERVEETIRLAKMNLAVHGLGGEIVPSNTYYDDPHHSRRPVRLRHRQPAVQRQRASTRTGSRTTSGTRTASRRPTTATTSGSRSSRRRSTTPGAPASSWPTPLPTPATPS